MFGRLGFFDKLALEFRLKMERRRKWKEANKYYKERKKREKVDAGK